MKIDNKHGGAAMSATIDLVFFKPDSHGPGEAGIHRIHSIFFNFFTTSGIWSRHYATNAAGVKELIVILQGRAKLMWVLFDLVPSPYSCPQMEANPLSRQFHEHRLYWDRFVQKRPVAVVNFCYRKKKTTLVKKLNASLRPKNPVLVEHNEDTRELVRFCQDGKDAIPKLHAIQVSDFRERLARCIRELQEHPFSEDETMTQMSSVVMSMPGDYWVTPIIGQGLGHSPRWKHFEYKRGVLFH